MMVTVCSTRKPARHDGQGVDERHGKHPQRDHRRHQGIVALGDGDELPGDEQAEHHAAVVAHEDAGAVLAAKTQVEPQKAGHAAEQRHGDEVTAAVARAQGDERELGERAGGDGARQAVDAVDHVERVDAADHAEHGEGHGDDAEADGAEKEGVAEIGKHHAAAIDHDEGKPGLDDEADAGAELPAVVGQAHRPHDERAHGERDPGERLCGQHPQQQARHQQQRGEHAKAADVGGAVVMLLVLAGVVDETDVRREVQHGSNDRRRQRRSQDEYKQAPHGDSSLYRCCACRLRGR